MPEPDPSLDPDRRQHRRGLLVTAANPGHAVDYVVRLETVLPAALVTLQYVPDRLLLNPASLKSYVTACAAQSLETLALMMVEDLNNELVPRWVRVTLCRDGDPRQTIIVEDRQPQWQNDGVLSRL